MTPQLNLTVLIIDDDDDDRFFIQKAFQTDSLSTQVYAAASGQQAFVMLGSLETLPKVILLDLNMPLMNGFDVLVQLKQSALYQQIPVIIVTTSQAATDQERAQGLGAAEFITKPTTYADMIDIAQRIRFGMLEGLND